MFLNLLYSDQTAFLKTLKTIGKEIDIKLPENSHVNDIRWNKRFNYLFLIEEYLVMKKTCLSSICKVVSGA